MSPARPFPFGSEPTPGALATVEKTVPVPSRAPQETAPLADFLPAGPALPFREAPSSLVLPTEPLAPLTMLALPTEPLAPLVPPLPPKEAPLHTVYTLWNHAAWALLLLLDLLILAYLFATWRQ